MWKEWFDIDQFLHNKAATVGIQTCEICDPHTGYLWKFEVHAGRDHSNATEDDPLSGVVPTLVLRLLNGLENRGHTVWMDHFYNSPALARELKTRGFDCVGTLRLDRQLVPIELASKSKKDMALGQICGSTSGDVDIVLWRDKSLVSLISTYHGLQTVSCSGKMKPDIIPDYNVRMGGVDRKAQMLAMYPVERKRTRIWYKKFFSRLLNVSTLNAFILTKSTDQTITHRKFRFLLVKQLLARNSNTQAAPPAMYPASAGHVPAQYEMAGPGRRRGRPRRVCAVCNKRTGTYCMLCNKPMCVFTCFGPHHLV